MLHRHEQGRGAGRRRTPSSPHPVGQHDAIGLGSSVEPILGNEQHAAPVNDKGHQEAPDAPKPSLFSWAEFMAEPPAKPTGRRRKAQAPALSLFEWALEQERAVEPAGLAG